MAATGGTIMAIRGIRARCTRTTWARIMAAMSIVVLQPHVGTRCSARAHDFKDHEVVDVARITCREFLEMPVARAFVVVGWIGGFYAGRNNDTKVDVLGVADEADKIIALCRENESMPLMTLVDRDLRRQHGQGDKPRPSEPHR
jgi:hypothetical protein